MNFYKSFMLIAVIALVASCQNPKQKDKMDQQKHGLDLHYMDTTANPKDDFYSYVNGTWMNETDIPDDQSSWGSFQILRKNTDKNVLALLNEAIENNHFKKGSDQAKAVLLYHSKLDTTGRNEAGLAPLKPIMEDLKQVQTFNDLQKLISAHPSEIANPFWGMYASSLPENSAMNGAYLVPGRLGLPDRDYYTNNSSNAKKVRQQYTDHIARMFQLWGDEEDRVKDKAQTILTLETQLAKPRMTKEDRRDIRKLNNPRSLKEIQKIAPAIDWAAWLDNLPVKKEIDTMIVTQPEYLKSLSQFLQTEDIKNLKTLVSWATLNSAAGDLTTELEKANWDFYSKTLNGVLQQRPADERALATINRVMGEALGKMYVEKYFPPKAKETAETMVHNIIETYKDRIQNLDWMTDSTKTKAIEKLDKLTVKIGYPDEWKDYSDMNIREGNTYYENLLAASQWHLNDNLSKINEPVDRKEWFMNPQTVNAYFNPSSNEIVFPAAIMQPPFFDYQADPAVNFGGIGAVIGHEISHAFDDSGARFDAEGNVNDWWTKEDQEKFKKRTQKLIDFYSQVKVEDSLHLNGAYTIGENVGDLGGVTAAYHGLERYFKTHDKPGKIDGFTQEQRFFMSWATVWRTKTRQEALRTQIKNDPHAPGYYRSYLPLQNVDEFYQAFDIQEGDKMYIKPEERIKIW